MPRSSRAAASARASAVPPRISTFTGPLPAAAPAARAGHRGWRGRAAPPRRGAPRRARPAGRAGAPAPRGSDALRLHAERVRRGRAPRIPSSSRLPCTIVPRTAPADSSTRPRGRGGSRSPPARCTRSTFSPRKVVSRSSSPSPSTCVPGRPSMPSRSAIARPSIWQPPQIPSTGRPAAACSRTARSRPRARIHAGRRWSPASRAARRGRRRTSARGSETKTTSRSGSRPSASTSVKLLIRGNRTTATLRAPPPDRRPSSSSASSESSHSDGSHGSDAEHPAPGERGQLAQPRREQRGIAAELVDHEARDQRLVRRREQRDACRTWRRRPRRGRCRRRRRSGCRRAGPAPCSRSRSPAG